MWKALVVLAVIVVLIIAVLGWPTRYRYDRISLGPNKLLVRVDRLTDRTELLDSNGWQTVREAGRILSSRAEADLPPSEVRKLEGTARLASGTLYVEVYNGSTWDLLHLTVAVKIKSTDAGRRVSRQYRLQFAREAGKPFRVATVSTELGVTLEEEDDFESWSIVSARGIKQE